MSAGLGTIYQQTTTIMSYFREDNYGYDYDYQQYLDWKANKEELDREYDEFEKEVEEEKTMTTGEKIVEDARKQEEEIKYDTKECGCSYFDGACDHEHETPHPSRAHGIDGTQCDCSDCTFDYGLCSCGCAGNAIKHAEWVEEQVDSFIHETLKANTTGGESAKTFKIDEEEEEEAEAEVFSRSSESSFTRDERFWEDLKVATATGLIAVFFGMYIGRYTCC
jgi:hypothetical protein